ncbi:MAG: hypothetical protein JWO81_1409 [Alphaproteobacteria bacterium]|nr:hypothetical protein [Alphaproteobacteria bacterium]
MDESLAPDVEAIYRMVALACAALVADKAKDHLQVMAIADSFLEYIDPLVAKDEGVKVTLDKKLPPKG